jgi:hypothetical protein
VVAANLEREFKPFKCMTYLILLRGFRNLVHPSLHTLSILVNWQIVLFCRAYVDKSP